jgi:hypothetical protein
VNVVENGTIIDDPISMASINTGTINNDSGNSNSRGSSIVSRYFRQPFSSFFSSSANLKPTSAIPILDDAMNSGDTILGRRRSYSRAPVGANSGVGGAGVGGNVLDGDGGDDDVLCKGSDAGTELAPYGGAV